MHKPPFRLRPLPFKTLRFLARVKRYLAAEPITAWLGAAFTLALAAFTLALVNVASKQTEILLATDRALHQTAKAADKMRTLAETTERAWIGPSSVRSEPFEARKPLKITLQYTNTGRLLASFVFANGGAFITKDAWNNGAASRMISVNEQYCMNGLPDISDSETTPGLAYPITGTSVYTIHFNSNHTNSPEKERFLIPDEAVSVMFLYYGCFVYQTG
jgi:hypothetical protein